MTIKVKAEVVRTVYSFFFVVLINRVPTQTPFFPLTDPFFCPFFPFTVPFAAPCSFVSSVKK